MLPVIILAGGLATRLRPITEKIPKALVEVNGRPFLDYQMRLLAANASVFRCPIPCCCIICTPRPFVELSAPSMMALSIKELASSRHWFSGHTDPRALAAWVMALRHKSLS